MIDTHCHIDDEQYAEDLDAFLDLQKQHGVELILVPATNADSCRSVLAVCARYPDFLVPALGLHPEDVKADWQEQLAAIHSLILSTLNSQPSTLIAIGEIGLDYHWDTTYREQQKHALRLQLDWALDLDLPVMLHARDATEDMLTILREYTAKGLRGVMHCFSGSHETAVELVKMGLYLGIGGVITFKNCKLQEALAGIPLNRLLLETDAPYMAPVPYRGQRNESRWMTYVVERLCQVYNLTENEIEKATNTNAKCLFRLQNAKKSEKMS